MITTERLTLVPSTVALARAEIADRGEFARLLDSNVPDNWPPESTADELPLFLAWLEAAPDQVGWFGWYALAQTGTRPTLVGCGGFLGPPQSGVVQIGYSILDHYQRQGYATEMMRGLVEWGLAQAGVSRMMAETEWANPASVRVLQKLGFSPIGALTDTGGRRFERLASAPAL